MKINCEILAVSSNGDTITLQLQGRGVNDAEWRPFIGMDVKVTDNAVNRRSFYLGRNVMVEVRPL